MQSCAREGTRGQIKGRGDEKKREEAKEEVEEQGSK